MPAWQHSRAPTAVVSLMAANKSHHTSTVHTHTHWMTTTTITFLFRRLWTLFPSGGPPQLSPPPTGGGQTHLAEIWTVWRRKAMSVRSGPSSSSVCGVL